MIRNESILEIIKGERNYKLSLSPESTLGEVFDVLNEMRNFIISTIKELEEIQKVEQQEMEK